jgi:hypothetical protein
MLDLYLTIRKPRNFLKLLCLFISCSVALHFSFGYDIEWGSTNMILSIEATIAGAVMLMVQEESAEMQGKTLSALLKMAEAAKERDTEQLNLMRSIRESDERFLKILTKENSDDLARSGD